MDNVSDEVLEVARNLFNGGDIDYTIDRYGKATVDTDELPDLDSYEYAYGTTREDILKQALDLIIEILPNVKFYNDYNNTGLYIELSDNHTFWSINGPDGFDGEFDYDLYNFFVEQACDEFETKTGVELYQCGRSGRHICVDVNFDNVLNYDNLCKLQAELEQQVIGEAESNCFGQAMEEAKELAPDEKVAKCLSCGMKIKYKNRDVQHDAMGDYLECPNCKATFDIDYDNIEPLLNMKAEKVEEGKDDGIFTKQDVKSYLGDIARVVANVVRKSAKSASVGMPDDGELMNKNSVIVYELPIKFIGDVVGLGEEIRKELLAVLESGKIKDVKCVPTTTKNGTVLTLSIIGNNIVNSSKTIEPREGSKKVEDLSQAEEIILADEINTYLMKNQLYPVDVFTADTRVMVEIEWGDWKHDHLRCDDLMKAKGYTLVEEEITEEDGSDCYSAIRHYEPEGKFKNIKTEAKSEKTNKYYTTIQTRLGECDSERDIITTLHKMGDKSLAKELFDKYKDLKRDSSNLLDDLIYGLIHYLDNKMNNSEDIKTEAKDYSTFTPTNGESKKVTEAEDMTQVKNDIETAVEKSDSTDLEKDQVKGSIDVLKTDEESAIEGYEDFNKETAEVVDKELSDAVNNQMKEIIDDEKEHIEKLDTIKSALSESKIVENYVVWQNDRRNDDLPVIVQKFDTLEQARKFADETDEDYDYSDWVLDENSSNFIEQCMKSGKFYDNQLEEILEGFDKGLTMEQVQLYADPQYDWCQMAAIRTGIEWGLSMEQVKVYADPKFNDKQMYRIRDSFWQDDMTLEQAEVYANPIFGENCMDEIISGFQNGLSIEQIQVYANDKFADTISANAGLKMWQIRKGFEDGLSMEQVLVYAQPKFSYQQMEQLRLGFENGLSIEQVKSIANAKHSYKQMGQDLYDMIQQLNLGEGMHYDDIDFKVCNNPDDGYGKRVWEDISAESAQEILGKDVFNKHLKRCRSHGDAMACNSDYTKYIYFIKRKNLEENDNTMFLNEVKFIDKVKSIKKSLKQKDKRLSDETAQTSAERIAGSMIKNEDKRSNDIYKYKGKEFRYDCDNAIVEYIWTDPDTNECIVIDEIGLSNDNWEDRKLRDAYLDEYIRQLDDEANRLADDFIANEYLGESLNQKISRKIESKETIGDLLAEIDDALSISEINSISGKFKNEMDRKIVQDEIDAIEQEYDIDSIDEDSDEYQDILNELKSCIASDFSGEEKNLNEGKLVEEEVDATIKESLNTGVLPIVNVDMYSIWSSGMLDNYDIPDEEVGKLDEIVQDIAPKYIKEAIQEILPSVEIYATGVYHPKEYNFGGDELEFDLVVNADEYNKLKDEVLANPDFNSYLKDNFSSRSGFISKLADNVDDFEDEVQWKQLVQVIMFAIRNENSEKIDEDYLNEFIETVGQEFPYIDEEDLEEGKKEELFNTDVNVNVDAGDIASGNNLDLGGLGEIASAVGLMASEEDIKSDKEELSENCLNEDDDNNKHIMTLGEFEDVLDPLGIVGELDIEDVYYDSGYDKTPYSDEEIQLMKEQNREQQIQNLKDEGLYDEYIRKGIIKGEKEDSLNESKDNSNINYDKGYAYLEKIAKENGENYYEIVEDTYEYPNGLMLITYNDEAHEDEKDHICIDLDNLQDLDERFLGPSDETIADSKAKGLYSESAELSYGDLEDLAKDIYDWYDVDMGTHFDEIQNNEETVYGDIMTVLETKDQEQIQHFIDDITEADIDDDIAKEVNIATTSSLLERLKALLK